MKALLVSPIKTVGGISIWTRHILEYYHNIDFDIHLDHFYADEKMINSDISSLYRIYLGITSYVPFLIKLRRKLLVHEYDIMHLASSASISLVKDIFAIKIAKKRGVKTIIHFRFGRIPELYESQNWEQKLIHKVIKLSDKVIVIDNKSYKALSSKGYRNVEVLPNPLAPEVNKIIHESLTTSRKANKILFVGHVLGTKGVFELIDACKNLRNSNKDIKLTIVGYVSETMKQKIDMRAGVEHNGWLEISGEKDYETTIHEMLTASVFVLPSYTEGFPNVILESMACACPIVATPVGAIPEMLNIENKEACGLCVEPRNVKQLQAAIVRMLDDEEFAKRCATNARKRVNEVYSLPSVWRQMTEIWHSALQ